MLDVAYYILISLLMAYLLVAAQKETPLLVLLHAIVQYLLTLGLWGMKMSGYIAGLLACFIFITSLVLVWIRNLNYSHELKILRIAFNWSQWVILGGLGIFMWTQSPFATVASSYEFHPHIEIPIGGLHPMVKVTGNVLMFSFLAQFFLFWGTKWTVGNSFRRLLPFLIYLVLVFFLQMAQREANAAPFL
ncbi:MAG: hypothetical protein AAGI38_24025 [Bacteroidota bacterium]